MLAISLFLALTTTVTTLAPTDTVTQPPIVHSEVGDSSAGAPDFLMVNVGKRHFYPNGPRGAADRDLSSPKSANFSHDGRRLYVNSLEGCRTIVYDVPSLEKIDVIHYTFPSGEGPIWGELSGFYEFTHYPDGLTRPFGGKPVESAWTHGGRYLWIPFYRRTYDRNAQDPSAVAVLDASADTIVRMFETGPLPKMVAASPDGRLVAITHWGDNTVGLIDTSDPSPMRWHHLPPVTIGRKLHLDYPLDRSVNRDAKSGNLLRGTIFTPDSHYLLVGGMAGPLAVIDASSRKHVGNVPAAYGIRHLAMHDGYVYGSQNVAGRVVRFPLDSLLAGVERARANNNRTISIPGGLSSCKVGKGARTLALSPDGQLAFVACNTDSKVYVMDALAMTVVDTIRADSYPVGLAVSPDGRYVAVTSQGRNRKGGNAVNLYKVIRPQAQAAQEAQEQIVEPEGPAEPLRKNTLLPRHIPWPLVCFLGACVALGIALISSVKRRRHPRRPRR